MHLLRVVASPLPLQRHARVVPAVRDRGDHRAVTGPPRGEAPKGGAQGEAPGGVRPRHRHRRARALGGPPVRRWPIPKAPLGRNLRRGLQEVYIYLLSVQPYFLCD